MSFHISIVDQELTLVVNRRDMKHIFRDPVSRDEVPDYFEIIKNPMSWSVIDAKLDSHEYWSLQAFKVCLIMNDFETNYNSCRMISILSSTTQSYTTGQEPPFTRSL